MNTHLIMMFAGVLLTLLSLVPRSNTAHSHATFSPHQFSVLDSSITFSAYIVNPDHDRYQIYWSEPYWTPRLNPRKKNEDMTKESGFASNWTLDFPSGEYHPGNYSIAATIYYDWSGFYPVEFDTELIPFTLTEYFTGRMVVNNVTRHRRNKSPFLISTKNETDIRIEVDGVSFLRNATNVTWSWWSNGISIGNTSEPYLKYNFTEAKTYEIVSRLEATFNNTLKPNVTVVKQGNFSANFTAKVPISKVNVTGDTWYRNDGRLFRIKITCEGTGPYKYCLMLHEGAYNITGNETCTSPEVTNDCEIPFAWLLGEGIHTLIILLENSLGSYVNQTAVHVYKVARVQPLSLILVPITCSLIALVLIIFGIGYFWENRKRYNVEVADFDFGQHDELPYMTFVERLQDAISSSALNRQRHIPPPDDHEPILSNRMSS